MKNLVPIILDIFIHSISIPVCNRFPIAVATPLLHRWPPYSGQARTPRVCHSIDFLVLGHPLPHRDGLIILVRVKCLITLLCHVYLVLLDGFRKEMGSLTTF